MSTFGAVSTGFAAIFSLEESTKWIMREGGNGISGTGSGAPTARGLKKSRGLRMASPGSAWGAALVMPVRCYEVLMMRACVWHSGPVGRLAPQ